MNKLLVAATGAVAAASLASVAWCSTSAPAVSPQSIAYTEAGEDMLAGKNAEGAIDQFETALAVDPKNVRAYIGLARAHDSLGLPGRAVKFYREGLTIDPQNLTALEEQGEALVKRGAVARAEKNLERIRDLCARECTEATRLAAVIEAGPPKVESAESVAKSDTLAPATN